MWSLRKNVNKYAIFHGFHWQNILEFFAHRFAQKFNLIEHIKVIHEPGKKSNVLHLDFSTDAFDFLP